MANARTQRLLWAALITLLAASPLAIPSSATAKKRITRAAEVPSFTFRGPRNPDELLATPEAFAPLAAAVRAHAEGVLRDYDIQDKTTLKNLHVTLAHLALLDGRDDEALEHVSAARRLEEKTDERLLGITFYSEAIAWARKDSGHGSGEFFLHSLRSHVSQYLDPLPWQEVRQAVARNRALLDLTSERIVPTWMGPRPEPGPDGAVSLELADQLIFQRLLLTLILPVKNEFMQELASFSDAHQAGGATSLPANIWRSRSVTLRGNEKLTPVVLAVWDTGVDTSIFPDRLYVNEREKPNGRDNDGNGFVSDVNGIGFRYDGARTPELLVPIDDEGKRLLEKERVSAQGASDFFSGVDSPEARAFRDRVTEAGAQAGADSVRQDVTKSRVLSHTHGTEVADIAVAGNPAARLLVVRQSFQNDRGDSPPRNVEGWRRFALNALAAVEYCKAHGVRVVNMSWSLSPPAGDENDAVAQRCFAMVKQGLTRAIRSAPEILFVAAAGNSNQDATFSEGIPPALELPNLLTVGAVDPTGHPTDFTSFGKTVVLYANGRAIEARVPGGERIPVSGTSLAAPQVVNLAAKLWAIDPSLKVAEVIELIKNGASPSPDGAISLINPKRSVVLLAIRNDKRRGPFGRW
jgi:hypothetical protein